MNKTRTETATIWICQNCMMVLANSDDSGREPDEPQPLSLIGDADVTCGMMFLEHDMNCQYAAGDLSADCDCETRAFSHAACEGCGGLAGERHAATLWYAP